MLVGGVAQVINVMACLSRTSPAAYLMAATCSWLLVLLHQLALMAATQSRRIGNGDSWNGS